MAPVTKELGAETPVNYPLDSSGFSNSLRIPTNLWKTSQCQIKKKNPLTVLE
jgi:hypothetical protein